MGKNKFIGCITVCLVLIVLCGCSIENNGDDSVSSKKEDSLATSNNSDEEEISSETTIETNYEGVENYDIANSYSVLVMTNHPKLFDPFEDLPSFYLKQINNNTVVVMRQENHGEDLLSNSLIEFDCFDVSENGVTDSDRINSIIMAYKNCINVKDYNLSDVIDLVKDYIPMDVMKSYYQRRFSSYTYINNHESPAYEFYLVYDNVGKENNYSESITIIIRTDYRGNVEEADIYSYDFYYTEDREWNYDILDESLEVPEIDYSEGIADFEQIDSENDEVNIISNVDGYTSLQSFFMEINHNQTSEDIIELGKAYGLNADSHVYSEVYMEITFKDNSEDDVVIRVDHDYVEKAFYRISNGFTIEYSEKTTITDDGFIKGYCYDVDNGPSYQEGIDKRFNEDSVKDAFEYAFSF